MKGGVGAAVGCGKALAEEKEREILRPIRLGLRMTDVGARGGWRMKGGFVYILASKSGVLYTGVTSNLNARIVEHEQKTAAGFSKKYNVTRLVHYEGFGDIRDAIAREKQIKGWLRTRKIELIESTNPRWKDLSEDLFPSRGRQKRDSSLRSE